MPPDFTKIQQDAQTINDQGSILLQRLSAFNATKLAGLTLTAGQKTQLKTEGLDALTAVENAAAAIRTELAVP